MASSLAERKPGGKKSRLEEGETRRVKTKIARKSRRIVGEAVKEHGSVQHGSDGSAHGSATFSDE